MLRNRLIILPILFIILLADIIHTNIISNGIESRFKRLHTSGVTINLVSEEKSFFHTKKELLITLEKSDLVSDALLELDADDPMRVLLSTMEGVTLKVILVHKKLIFSNNLQLTFRIVTLPEHFQEASLLLANILEYTLKHPDLFKANYHVWKGTFSFAIASLKERFEAENNISYDIEADRLKATGFLHAKDDFKFSTSTQKFILDLYEGNSRKIRFELDQGGFSTEKTPQFRSLEINGEALHLTLPPQEQNSTIKITDFHAKQSQSDHKFTDIESNLYLGSLSLQSQGSIYAVKNFNYDLDLYHLDRKVLDRIGDLIGSSNQSEVLFIFEDLSKELSNLLQEDAAIHLKKLSFDGLIFKDKPYNEASFSLLAKSGGEETPIAFESKIHLSQEIYTTFLEHIPNAGATKPYLKDPNVVDFDLNLSPRGLVLNGHLLTLAESNTTQESITDEKSD